MTDGDAILKGILLEPDEDVPRLAYADYLDENGQPERAEFIRVQCELARLDPGYPNGQRYATLMIRERELFEAHARDWTPGELVGATPTCEAWFSMQGGAGHSVAQFRRGFVDHVGCRAIAWLDHGDSITANHPVQNVTLRSLPDWCHRDGAVYLYEGSPPGIGQTKGRRCLNATTETKGDVEKRITGMEAILRAEWPGVKTWNLPPAGITVTGLGRVRDAFIANARAFATVGVTTEEFVRALRPPR